MHVCGLLDRIRACAMPGGDIECRGTWLKQEGEMRFAPDRPWLPFKAEQWFLGCGIDFRWRAWIRINPLSPARVVDSFENGRGLLTVKLFGFIPVLHSQGPETDRGESLAWSGRNSLASVRLPRVAKLYVGERWQEQFAFQF